MLQMVGLRKCAWDGCILYNKAVNALDGKELIVLPAKQRMCCKCSNMACDECEVHVECYAKMEDIATQEVIRSKRSRVDTAREISKGLWTHFTEIGKTPRFQCKCGKGNILPIVGVRREEVVVVDPGMGGSIDCCGDHISGWRLSSSPSVASDEGKRKTSSWSSPKKNPRHFSKFDAKTARMYRPPAKQTRPCMDTTLPKTNTPFEFVESEFPVIQTNLASMSISKPDSFLSTSDASIDSEIDASLFVDILVAFLMSIPGCAASSHTIDRFLQQKSLFRTFKVSEYIACESIPLCL